MTSAAVIGLGQMGQGIARALDRAGMLTRGFDLDPGAFAKTGFSEAVIQADAGALLNSADVLFFVVPSTRQIAEFLQDAQGRTGQVVVDMTTSSPAQSKALGSDLAARGFCYVDAAMTGGAAGADAGTLTLMMGGDPAVIESIAPQLNIISSQQFHLGETGSGHAMKLVHNLILHSSFMATCEGLAIAQKAGLDVAQANAVLNAGNARSFVTEVRFPRDILSGSMNARSRISNLEKDLGLARGFAAGLESPAPYTAVTHDLLASALDRGAGDRDFSWLFEMFEGLARVAKGPK